MNILSRLKSRLGEFWWYSLLIFLSCRFGDAINAFVGVWLVPRYVGTEELGAVLPLMQASTAWVTPLVILNYTFLKYVTVYATNHEYGKLKSLLRCVFVFVGGYAVFSALAARFVFPHFFARIRVAEGTLGLLIIAVGLANTAAPYFQNALQGLKRFTTISALNILSAPARLLVLLVLLPIRPLSGYLAGQTAGPVLLIATALFSLRKELGRGVTSVPFWRYDGWAMAKYTLPFLLSTFVGMVNNTWIPILIRQRLPVLESGAYYMLSRFAEIGSYVGFSLTVVLFPMAVEAREKGADGDRLFFKSYFGALVPGLAFAVLFHVVGAWGCARVSDWRPFLPYVKYLPLLTVIQVLRVCVTNYCFCEYAQGRFWQLLYGLPLSLFEVGFLAVCSGIDVFAGVLPSAWIASVKALNPCSLEFYLATFLGVSVLTNVLIWVEWSVRRHARA